MEDDNKLSFFFLGLGLGVAVGILFAPKSGAETRNLIASKAGESTNYLKRRSEEIRDSAGDLLDKGRGVINKQRDTLNQAMEAGKQAYRDAVGGQQQPNAPNQGF